MKQLNVFNSDIEETYIQQCIKVFNTPGIDCSELVEDMISAFGGSALLILSSNYSKGEMFSVQGKSGIDYQYLYHYAYVSKDNKVYDSYLGICSDSIGEYLDVVRPHPISINSVEVRLITDQIELTSFI